MILIGLTGGVASGKSTVASVLASKGAVIIDADRLVHEAYRSGTPVHEAVVDRFGPDFVAGDGSIDRSRLGKAVFQDERARRDLEAIVHPEVYKGIMEGIEQNRGTDKVVVVDAALLVETGRGGALGLDALVVVAADVDEQIRRMIDHRGLTEEAARARIGAQAPSSQKLAVADYVIDNRLNISDLKVSVDALWSDLHERFG